MILGTQGVKILPRKMTKHNSLDIYSYMLLILATGSRNSRNEIDEN